MPTYEHICRNKECNYEWEDVYSITKDPPKACPKCNQETAERVISLGGKGVVELYGQDLVSKIKGDANQLKKDMKKSENVYANLLGYDKYQSLQQRIDSSKKDRNNY